MNPHFKLSPGSRSRPAPDLDNPLAEIRRCLALARQAQVATIVKDLRKMITTKEVDELNA
jgi:hypothetical protein